MRKRQAKKIQRRTYRMSKYLCPYKVSTLQQAERVLERTWKRHNRIWIDDKGRFWRSVDAWSYRAARMRGFWIPYQALRRSLGPERWRIYRRTGEL